jgi:hypothetical protein
MFEKSLEDKLKRIFGLNKVTFNQSSDSHEQDVLFIEIEKARAAIKDGLEVYHVNGNCRVYSPHEKMPFGYFSKHIRNADPDDTKDLFFYDLEESSKVYANIAMKSFSFVYFFSGQYDPEVGTITSITMDIGDE